MEFLKNINFENNSELQHQLSRGVLGDRGVLGAGAAARRAGRRGGPSTPPAASARRRGGAGGRRRRQPCGTSRGVDVGIQN